MGDVSKMEQTGWQLWKFLLVKVFAGILLNFLMEFLRRTSICSLFVTSQIQHHLLLDKTILALKSELH